MDSEEVNSKRTDQAVALQAKQVVVASLFRRAPAFVGKSKHFKEDFQSFDTSQMQGSQRDL